MHRSTLYAGYAVFLFYLTLGLSTLSHAASAISLSLGFSVPLQLPEAASTVAVGNPDIIGTNTLRPDLLMLNGQTTGATSLTVFGKSGKVYEYRIQVGNDVQQLRSIINTLEKNVTVEDLNGIIVLRGKVQTPTALVRVLTLADRYVTGSNAPPDFSVISDRGGVLAGNLDEGQTGIDEEITGVSPDPRIAIPSVQFNGNANNANNSGNGNSNNANANAQRGGVAQALRQPLMPIKGNLAQNIARGEVVVVGGGRVMSMIQVAKQPKVEIQMQIIGVDRTKTDELGIDWRLDANSGGKTVTVGSVMGDISPSGGQSPTQLINNGFDPGNSSVFAFINNPGVYALSTFMRFLSKKGAAKTLSQPLVSAISGESASFLVGGNIPIPTQTAVTTGNLTAAVAVTTNVRFIQFGLKLIVRPTVLENGKIAIVLDQSISEPDYTQSITLLGARIPGFNQRSVSTITESANGESWAVAGLLSEENVKNQNAVPWLSNVPVLGWLFKNKSDSKSRNELMILVNARILEGEAETTNSFDGIGELSPPANADAPLKDEPIPEDPNSLPPVSDSKKNAVPAPKAPVGKRKSVLPVSPRATGPRAALNAPHASEEGVAMASEAIAPEAMPSTINVADGQAEPMPQLILPTRPVLAGRSPSVLRSSAMANQREAAPVTEAITSAQSAAELKSPAVTTGVPETHTAQATAKPASAQKTVTAQPSAVASQASHAARPLTAADALITTAAGSMGTPNQFLVKPKPVPGRVYRPFVNPDLTQALRRQY